MWACDRCVDKRESGGTFVFGMDDKGQGVQPDTYTLCKDCLDELMEKTRALADEPRPAGYWA